MIVQILGGILIGVVVTIGFGMMLVIILEDNHDKH